jgi:hypothetical protein
MSRAQSRAERGLTGVGPPDLGTAHTWEGFEVQLCSRFAEKIFPTLWSQRET